MALGRIQALGHSRVVRRLGICEGCLSTASISCAALVRSYIYLTVIYVTLTIIIASDHLCTQFQEPPKNLDLVQHRNVLATPHLGASTNEAQTRVAEEIAQQFIDARDGKSLFGAVSILLLVGSLHNCLWEICLLLVILILL